MRHGDYWLGGSIQSLPDYEVWADDTGFDIASGAARPNEAGLQVPNVSVG